MGWLYLTAQSDWALATEAMDRTPAMAATQIDEIDFMVEDEDRDALVEANKKRVTGAW